MKSNQFGKFLITPFLYFYGLPFLNNGISSLSDNYAKQEAFWIYFVF